MFEEMRVTIDTIDKVIKIHDTVSLKDVVNLINSIDPGDINSWVICGDSKAKNIESGFAKYDFTGGLSDIKVNFKNYDVS